MRRIAESVFEKELQVRALFRKWGTSGDGSLSISEFTAALNSLGFSVDLQDAKALFRHFDVVRARALSSPLPAADMQRTPARQDRCSASH